MAQATFRGWRYAFLYHAFQHIRIFLFGYRCSCNFLYSINWSYCVSIANLYTRRYLWTRSTVNGNIQTSCLILRTFLFLLTWQYRCRWFYGIRFRYFFSFWFIKCYRGVHRTDGTRNYHLVHLILDTFVHQGSAIPWNSTITTFWRANQFKNWFWRFSTSRYANFVIYRGPQRPTMRTHYRGSKLLLW